MEISIKHREYDLSLIVGSGSDVTASLLIHEGRHQTHYALDRTKHSNIDTLIAGVVSFAQQLYQLELARYGSPQQLNGDDKVTSIPESD